MDEMERRGWGLGGRGMCGGRCWGDSCWASGRAIPDLIVTSRASPHLDHSPVVSVPISQIEALVVRSPFDRSARRSELLVRITRGAVVNLHFVSICGGAGSNVETFGATEN